METLPTYDIGHAIVAAIRVITHRDGRVPTDEDIADLLGMPADEALLWIRGLERHGAVQVVKTPFEQRVDIRDHTTLETLPRTHDPDELKEELSAFHDRTEAHQEHLERLLGEDPDRKVRSRADKLTEELERFKSSGRGRSPFKPRDDE